MVTLPAIKQQRQGPRRAVVLVLLAICVLALCWAHVTALRATVRNVRDASILRPRHKRLLADAGANSGGGITTTQGVTLGSLGQFSLAQLQATDAARAQLSQQPKGFVPGAVWKDLDGKPIQAHGGSVLEHEGVFYWFGEHKGGTTYFSHTIGYSTPRVDFIGISCYSSKDLLNWRFEGLALKSGQHAELAPERVAERPRVLYNNATRTFVMWCHVDEADYELARVGIAVSSSPQGPYEYRGSYRPHGQQARDLTVFQDEDSSAYLAYSSESNMVMHIARLRPDYLAPEPSYQRVMVDRKREAPAVFKHAGQYFMLTSGCQGWDPSASEVFVASHMLGEWRSLGNPCTGASQLERLLTYFAQATHVIPYRRHPGSFILMADRWAPDNLGSSRYVWLPMWAMELSPVQQVEAAQRLKGVGALPGTASTAQLPARIPVAGVDVVVRWMNSWTLEDLGEKAVSRFAMP